MATQNGTNSQQFPPQSSNAVLDVNGNVVTPNSVVGPSVVIAHFDDGSSTVTITKGSDGALPPGVATIGATINPYVAP